MTEKPHIKRSVQIENPEMGVVTAHTLCDWQYKSCEAEVGIGNDWATIYFIKSNQPSKGHATKLLLAMKEYYEGRGLRFGGSVALNGIMRHLYQKCGIYEYTSKDI